ncbi:MAG TPA: FapA family protein, partial [Spirochaetota bacterium]|nr:FapA family protein [Spirochaetota bacterium]
MRYKELQFSIPAERLLTPAVLKQNAGRLERLCSHLDDFLADNDKLRGDMDMSVFKDMQAVSCARGERVAVLSMQNSDRQQSGPAAVVRADNTAELETGPGVSVNEQGNRQELQAAVSGYLYFDGHKLDIFSPLVLSPQMVFMYYIDLNQTGRPVYPDKKEYFAFIKKNRINIDYLLIRDFKNEQDLGRSFQIRTAAKGLVPAFGKNTSVEYDINPELKPGTIDTDGRIDYLERDFAKNVKPGDLLCTFYKGAANRDGKNIRGKIIKTKRATVQPFYAGDNVSTEEDEEKILYKAASQGIVKYDKNSVAVSETLFIFGDVDLSRGNINSDIDIFIKGNIKAGLKVKSKRSIRLAGNVENGALVEAGEEFVGRGGVLGEKTLVRAASRLSALFVEGAEVCCEGDILIERYLLNATVKSLGDILVSGKNFQNANRGAVINCRVYFQKVFRSRGMGA